METNTETPQREPRRTMTARTVFTSGKDCAEKIERYFEEYLPSSEEVADIEGLADFLGVTRRDLIALTEHKIKKQLAFRGKLPAAVLSFDLKNNHGYRDRPEEQQEGAVPTVIFQGRAEDWAR